MALRVLGYGAALVATLIGVLLVAGYCRYLIEEPQAQSRVARLTSDPLLPSVPGSSCLTHARHAHRKSAKPAACARTAPFRCPVELGDRRACARAVQSGRAVMEFEPKGAAADEIARLWRDVDLRSAQHALV
jgi:hypothetical protein